jgi:hypothetical protein
LSRLVKVCDDDGSDDAALCVTQPAKRKSSHFWVVPFGDDVIMTSVRLGR